MLALEDFSRFQKQKDLDLQETVSSYVVEQIKAARRVINSIYFSTDENHSLTLQEQLLKYDIFY